MLLASSQGLMDSPGKIQIWNVSDHNVISQLDYPGKLYTASFSPDEKTVITASASRAAIIWDVQTGNQIYKLTHDDEVQWASFSHDESLLIR